MTAPARGLTLIELLISTAIAMLIAGLTITTFLQIRRTVGRAESRVAMHASAQSVYAYLQRSFSGLMQDGAMVAASTPRTTAVVGGQTVVTPGSVSLVFLRGKEATDDWRTSSKAGVRMNSDLVWEEWIWKGSTSILYAASSSPLRTPAIGKSFVPAAGAPNYQKTGWWQGMANLPQPRRVLDPADPTRSLDDNLFFPDPASPAGAWTSLADPSDVGDWTDLQRQLAPALEGLDSPTPDSLPAFALQLVAHDGTVTTIDDAAAATIVLPGAWLDGRLAATVAAPQVFATSDAAKRPKLIRIRFILHDRKADLYQTFSFSFALPGLASSQPGAVP